MISHGVKISIVGGGAEEKDGARQGSFFFFSFFSFFLYHVFVVKVQETARSGSYGVNKTLMPTTARFTPTWENPTPRTQSTPSPLVAPKTKARRSNTFLQTRKERHE